VPGGGGSTPAGDGDSHEDVGSWRRLPAPTMIAAMCAGGCCAAVPGPWPRLDRRARLGAARWCPRRPLLDEELPDYAPLAAPEIRG